MASTTAPQFASLYVGDLHPDVTEAMLYEVFNAVGPVGSIRVCRDSITRKSLGYGYVNFHSVSDAERALDTLNYRRIKGCPCRIMWSQRDPSLRKSGLGNIFVKNLDRNIDNKALFDTFSLFGNILSCKVSTDHAGTSRGVGFVHYETEEAAKQAIERVNGMQIGEKTVEVCVWQKRNDRDVPSVYTNLYIKNLPAEFDEGKLKDLFLPFGKITSAAVQQDRLGRKFAFVNYEDHESALKAVEELNGRDMRDEQKKSESGDQDSERYLLYVGRAQSKGERQREFRQKAAQSGTNTSAGVNLYVKNLNDDASDETLKELFEPYGNVVSVAAMKDEQGKCKGFGFVCFASSDEATKAVTEMHLKVANGKPLYVGLAEKREQRQERLKARYTPANAPMKNGGKGKGGPPGPNMTGQMGQQMQMMGPMMGMKGQQMQMMGPMMGMKGQQMQMMGPIMGMKGMPGKGSMMPQMMSMMAAKGQMPQEAMMKGAAMMPMGMRPMNMAPGGGMPARQGMPPQQQQGPPSGGSALSASALAAAPPPVQKQMLGEKLFPAIQKYQPALAGKITGMMLEMDNSELLIILESEQQLKQKVDEAMRVLEKS